MIYQTSLRTPFEIGGILSVGVLPQDSRTPYRVSLSNEKPVQVSVMPTYIYLYAQNPASKPKSLPLTVKLNGGQFIPYKRADSSKTIFPKVSSQAQQAISTTAEEVWLNTELGNLEAIFPKDAPYLKNLQQKRVSTITERIHTTYTDPIVQIGNEKPVGPEENVNIYGFTGTVALLGLKQELMKIAELASLISKKKIITKKRELRPETVDI